MADTIGPVESSRSHIPDFFAFEEELMAAALDSEQCLLITENHLEEDHYIGRLPRPTETGFSVQTGCDSSRFFRWDSDIRITNVPIGNVIHMINEFLSCPRQLMRSK